MKSHRILPAALLLFILGACTRSPTDSGHNVRPGSASYDGGFTIGSGNSGVSSGGYGMGSGNEAAPETTTTSTTTSEDDSARSGYTIGSGT